jgi:ribonuclease D
MPPAGLPEPVLITQPKQLAALVQQLLGEPIIAVDTESNSLYAYQEQVCLVQFSTPAADYLVDPLVLLDFSPLSKIFAHPKIEKIFHAAEYDLICLKRDFNLKFANLFDTMLAARVVGRKAVGLGSLLEAEFGIKLDKRYQRADWGQRPLPGNLLDYARMDTHYLIKLRHRLKIELDQSGRWHLAAEDFQRLCNINERDMPAENEPNFSVNGSNDLSPQQRAVLLELSKYRDRIARLQDRPLFKVIGNKTLLEIAETCPTRMEDLSELNGMTPRQVKRHGKQLLQAVERGLKADPIQPRRHSKPDDRLLTRLDLLRDWRKEMARKMRVESDIILPRDLMVEIAENNPTCREELAEVMQTAPWRLDQFGEQILDRLRQT